MVSKLMRYRGDWEADATYFRGQVVLSDGDPYIAKEVSQGISPSDGATWEALGGEGGGGFAEPLTLTQQAELEAGFRIPSEDDVTRIVDYVFKVDWTNGPVGEPNYADYVSIRGFNVQGTGSPINSGRAALWLQMEDRFYFGEAGGFGTEWHWNVRRPGQALVRTWGQTIEHATGKVVSNTLGGHLWQNSPASGTLMELDEPNELLKLYNTVMTLAPSSTVRGTTQVGATASIASFYSKAGSTQSTNLLLLQKTDSTTALAVSTAGAVTIASTTTINASQLGTLTVTPRSTTEIPLFVKQIASHAVRAISVQDSAGSEIWAVNQSGRMYSLASSGSISAFLGASATGGSIGTETNHAFFILTNNTFRSRFETNGNVSITGNMNSYGSGVLVVAFPNATTVPTADPSGGGLVFADSGSIAVRGAANSPNFKSQARAAGNMCALLQAASGQTASILEAQDNTGAVLSKIGKGGRFATRVTSAPADADVATSEAVLWFDNTNGAGKLMVKAKTANGTVVTGSVTLA